MLLDIPPVTQFPALEAVELSAPGHKRSSAFFAQCSKVSEEEWVTVFKGGTLDTFPSPGRGQFWDCAGLQKVFVGPLSRSTDAWTQRLLSAYTQEYANTWLGKYIMPDWQAQPDAPSSFVANKFSELGRQMMHPMCSWEAGLELSGRIAEGTSIVDGRPCFVLTYGSQSGRQVLSTQPVPVALGFFLLISNP